MFHADVTAIRKGLSGLARLLFDNQSETAPKPNDELENSHRHTELLRCNLLRALDMFFVWRKSPPVMTAAVHIPGITLRQVCGGIRGRAFAHWARFPEAGRLERSTHP